jgi:suppressor of ftsI
MRRPALTILAVTVLALALGPGAGVLMAGGDDNNNEQAASGPAVPATILVLPPEPFKAGLPFSEPPAVPRSKRGLRATLVAQNRTVPVSGIDVAGAQTYSARRSGGRTTKPGFLGPTLHARPGDMVELTLDNRLTVPDGSTATNCAEAAGHEDGQSAQGETGDAEFTNVHFHGLHVTPRRHSPYGDTVLVRLPNGKSRIRFKIPRNHDRGTFWYHAHLHQCTDDEVTRGLAGLLLVGDSRKDLPPAFRSIRTRSLALKDVQVTPADGGAGWQIDPQHNFFSPTHRTVNGLVNPRMTIRPGETQMWRLLNASAGVWYRVALVDDADRRDRFTVIAQDGNSLRRPVERTTLLIPPGARFDVLVRGPETGSRILKTLPFDQGFANFPEDTLATLEVSGPAADPLPEPDRLAPPKQRFPKERGPTRRFTFDIDLRDTQFHISDPPKVFLPTIDNALFDPKSPAVTPVLGTTERWILLNKSAEWHPFHIHQDDFRVVSTSEGGQPRLPGDHDVFALPPGTPSNPSVTEIDMPFTDFAGNFVFHCHILDHEDGGMMALIELRRRAR